MSTSRMKRLYVVEWKASLSRQWRFWSAERFLANARFEAKQIESSYGTVEATRITRWEPSK